MNVRAVGRDIYGPWLLNRHYARRIPPVQYAYGIWDGGQCFGVVTYGPPASPQVYRSVVDSDAFHLVIELNRLSVDDDAPRNTSSALVGRSLQLLPRPRIVVSYADGGHGHVGYIYQATNFKYYGETGTYESEFITPEGDIVHRRTITGRGISNPTTWALANGWVKKEGKPKHRYVFACGSSRQRRNLYAKVKWTEQAYPKGDTTRHDFATERNDQVSLF